MKRKTKRKQMKGYIDHESMNYLIKAEGDVVVTDHLNKTIIIPNIKASAGTKNLGRNLKSIILGLRESMLFIALSEKGGVNLRNTTESANNYELTLKLINDTQIRNFSYKVEYIQDKGQSIKTFNRSGKRYIGITQKGKKGFVTYQKYKKLPDPDEFI